MKQTKITELINFKIEEDCVKSRYGVFFFYRIYPPNLSILTDNEKSQRIDELRCLLNGIEYPMQIYIADKSEDLSLNRGFLEQVGEEYSFMSEAIMAEVSKAEKEQSGAQRAFYFILCEKGEGSYCEGFENLLSSNDFGYYKAQKPELVSVIRGFLNREFIDSSIFIMELEEDSFD